MSTYARPKWTRKRCMTVLRAPLLLLPVMALLSIVPARQAAAQTAAPLQSIDLTHGQRAGWFYKQDDPRWQEYPIGPDPLALTMTMGECGCLLTVLGSVLQYHFYNRFGVGGSLPWFALELPVPLAVNNFVKFYEFSPPYVNDFLTWGRTLAPNDEPRRPKDWGFKPPNGSNGCGVAVRMLALTGIAIPTLPGFSATGLIGNFAKWFGKTGGCSAFPCDLKGLILSELVAGNPVGAAGRIFDGGNFLGNHIVLIVGWDEAAQKFLILDPASDGPWSFAHFPDDYAVWESRLLAVATLRPTANPGDELLVEDDPSPIELRVFSPDGQRSGYDPATQDTIREDADVSYYELGGWWDPTGTVPPGDPQKFLSVQQPKEGVYRIEVIGTGAGPFTLTFSTAKGDLATPLQHVDGTITQGQSYKYEVLYSASGAHAFSQVTNFTPQAIAGEDLAGLTRTPIAFDGTRSFDADGQIVAYQWDFGDGASSTGSQATHAYATAGIYMATLAVTDNQGASTADTVRVLISPADAIPPTTVAVVSPAPNVAGVSPGPVTVSLTATDAPNGIGVRSVTYSLAGAQAMPETTVPGAAAQITITAEGSATVSYFATNNDGAIEAKHTVTVTVDRVPPVSTVRNPAQWITKRDLTFMSGSAQDLTSGVASVEVSVRRHADGRYWNGGTWVNGEYWLRPIGTHFWSVATGLPAGLDLPDGHYTLRSRATDIAGNVETPNDGVTFYISAATENAEYLPDPKEPFIRDFSTAFMGLGINATGHIVGIDHSYPLAFLRLNESSGQVISIGPLPSDPYYQDSSSVAYGINDYNEVVGTSGNAGRGDHLGRAFRWVDGTMTYLGALGKCSICYNIGDAHSAAYDINNAGQIVGESTYNSQFSDAYHAFVWEKGVMQDLGALPGDKHSAAVGINKKGQIVGWSAGSKNAFSDPQKAVLWDKGIIKQLYGPGRSNCAASINDRGDIVGTAVFLLGNIYNNHAIVWKNEEATDLGPGVTLAINTSGEIVGATDLGAYGDVCYDLYKYSYPFGARAVRWKDGVMTDLNTLLPANSGWQLVAATDINDAGEITGYGYFNGRPAAFRLIPMNLTPPYDIHASDPDELPTTINHPPTANAGPDQTVEATAAAGASVTLNGAASGDPDGDVLTFTWTGPFGTATGQTPTVTVPLGVQSITLTVNDGKGDTASDTVVVKIVDTTPPAILCPADITSPVGQAVTLRVPNVADKVDLAPVVSNNALASFPPGLTTVTWTAADHSGNSAACQQKVTLLYTFTGFFQPVDNPPTFNQVTAGQAIPVKFSLSGNQGLSIFAAGYPLSQAIACSSGMPIVDIEQTVTAGSSSLSYDAGTDQYIYVWKTDKAWAGTCRQLVVRLNDGTNHKASFKFK
jgi:probable HAF family extracellular repeat protein